VRDIPLRAGRPLRVVRGTLDQLAALEIDRNAWLKVIVEEMARTGLADEVRDLFPDAVDVCIAAPATTHAGRPHAPIAQRSPAELFTAFLADRGIDDPDLARLFADVLDEVQSAGDEAAPVRHEQVA
jgi:exonuclease SbcD